MPTPVSNLKYIKNLADNLLGHTFLASDVNSEDFYINHSLSLFKVALRLNLYYGDPNFLPSVNLLLSKEDRFIDWLIRSPYSIPRVVRVGFWLAIDFDQALVSSVEASSKLLSYISRDYIIELRDYLNDNSKSVFLRAYIIYYTRLYFVENKLLANEYKSIYNLYLEFFNKYPIFVFSYLFNEAKYIPLYPESSDYVPVDPDLHNRRIITIGSDVGFYKRLLKGVDLLTGMNSLELLLCIGMLNQWRYSTVALYDELVVFLREKGIQFDGDDPLGVRNILPEWNGDFLENQAY